jgi:hypothetical protein
MSDEDNDNHKATSSADGSECDEDIAKRRSKNRVNARRSRERKRLMLDTLQQEHWQLHQENKRVKTDNDKLREAITTIKSLQGNQAVPQSSPHPPAAHAQAGFMGLLPNQMHHQGLPNAAAAPSPTVPNGHGHGHGHGHGLPNHGHGLPNHGHGHPNHGHGHGLPNHGHNHGHGHTNQLMELLAQQMLLQGNQSNAAQANMNGMPQQSDLLTSLLLANAFNSGGNQNAASMQQAAASMQQQQQQQQQQANPQQENQTGPAAAAPSPYMSAPQGISNSMPNNNNQNSAAAGQAGLTSLLQALGQGGSGGGASFGGNSGAQPGLQSLLQALGQGAAGSAPMPNATTLAQFQQQAQLQQVSAGDVQAQQQHQR